MDRIRYIQKLNRKRCIFGLILSITIAVFIFYGVLLALKERFGSAIELSELCRIYTDTYLGKDAGGSISE